jgi:hypothetical protein
VTTAPSQDGPFQTRQQAAAAFADWLAGPRGGISATASQHAAEALTDTLDVLGVPLGAFDRAVVSELAELDPLTVAIVMSWLHRAARDQSRP